MQQHSCNIQLHWVCRAAWKDCGMAGVLSVPPPQARGSLKPPTPIMGTQGLPTAPHPHDGDKGVPPHPPPPLWAEQGGPPEVAGPRCSGSP